MSLEEVLRPVKGRRRRYLLYRIAEVNSDVAQGLCGIKKTTMNTWLKDEKFVALHRQVKDLAEYKKDAISMLRRDTQLAAVMLERDIIDKMKGEIENGQYELIRTPLAKDVYNKLIADLDVSEVPKVMTWEQRIQALIINEGDNGEQEPSKAQSIASKLLTESKS